MPWNPPNINDFFYKWNKSSDAHHRHSETLRRKDKVNSKSYLTKTKGLYHNPLLYINRITMNARQIFNFLGAAKEMNRPIKEVTLSKNFYDALWQDKNFVSNPRAEGDHSNDIIFTSVDSDETFVKIGFKY